MMKLIDDAGRAWRLFTVQIGAVAVVWGSMPAELQTDILSLLGVPPERVPAILGLLVILARLVSQQPERQKPQE